MAYAKAIKEHVGSQLVEAIRKYMPIKTWRDPFEKLDALIAFYHLSNTNPTILTCKQQEAKELAYRTWEI